jgi:hypothetical protein
MSQRSPSLPRFGLRADVLVRRDALGLFSALDLELRLLER